MLRAANFFLAASLALMALPGPLPAQSAADVQNYFQGKQVQLKIDMPGSQQGVDLRFDRGTPMDWKQYSSRLKKFGVAIPKDARSTVTTITVKKDLIEFQLDGGGFGTFGDDTNTTVNATPVERVTTKNNSSGILPIPTIQIRSGNCSATWIASAIAASGRTTRINATRRSRAKSRASRWRRTGCKADRDSTCAGRDQYPWNSSHRMQ